MTEVTQTAVLERGATPLAPGAGTCRPGIRR